MSSVDRPAPSRTTATGLPSVAVSVKTSTCANARLRLTPSSLVRPLAKDADAEGVGPAFGTVVARDHLTPRTVVLARAADNGTNCLGPGCQGRTCWWIQRDSTDNDLILLRAEDEDQVRGPQLLTAEHVRRQRGQCP